MATSFGDVRSLLQRRPTTMRWLALLELLSAIEDEGARQEAIHYAKGHLNAWPDRMRGINTHYQGRLELLPLVRAMMWGEDEWQYSLEELLEHLERPLTTLSLHESIEASRVLTILEHPSVATTLQVLHLNAMHLDEPAQYAQLFERLSQMPALEEVAFDRHAMDVATLDRLLACFAPGQQLRRLSLQSCELGAAHLECLADHPGTRGLKWLAIGQNDLSAADIAKLNEGRSLLGLSWLSLWSNPIGDAGVEALGKEGRFAQLRHLNIGGAELGSQVIDKLLETSFGAELETLWMWGAQTPRLSSMSKLLSRTPRRAPRAALKRLNLNNIALNTRLAEVIGQSYGAAGLERLHLYNCQLTEEQLSGLLVQGQLSRLQELDLRSNPALSAASMQLFRHTPRLRELDLANRELSWEELEGFFMSDLVPELRCVKLSISPEDKARLQTMLRQCPHRPDDLLFEEREEEAEQPFDDFTSMSDLYGDLDVEL